MTLHLYGIPNCDMVKKARAWLDARGINHAFHDYKKEGVDQARLERWCEKAGWEVLLNRRGTTFRALGDADKADIDRAKAIRLMGANPSLIKRPVVEHNDAVLVGFDPGQWGAVLDGVR